MFIFWNHGAGWTGFGGDDISTGHPILTIAALEQGLSQGLARTSATGFDILGFDACLMATYEVAKAMSPFADYLLASQELEPTHGWDYRRFAALCDDPTMAPTAVAADIIDGYFAQAAQLNTGQDLTLSLVDLSRMSQLTQAVEAFATRLATLPPQDFARLGQARGNTLRFAKNPDLTREPHLVDLGDFARPLGSLAGASAEAQQLRTALAAAVLPNLVRVIGYGGLMSADETYAQILSTFPAELVGQELRVEWFGEYALLSQGTSVEPGFLDFYDDPSTGDTYVDIPFHHTSQGGDVTYVVRSDVIETVYLELQAWDYAGNMDWANGILPAPNADPCFGVTEVGECDGTDLYFCEDGQLYYIDCAEYGLQCRFDAQEGYYDCL